MPVELRDLAAPAHCALLVMECQEGVIGTATGNALAEAVARQGMVPNIAALLDAARAAAVPIFYLNASRRTDHRGTSNNCLLLALGRKADPLVVGSSRQAVVAALQPRDGDFVLNRVHGVTPFHGTELDSILRNMGIRTVVAVGVSLNIGIFGLTLEAVNAGYQVVLPRDAVAGTPSEYAEAVLKNSLHLLATISDVAALRRCWQP